MPTYIMVIFFHQYVVGQDIVILNKGLSFLMHTYSNVRWHC